MKTIDMNPVVPAAVEVDRLSRSFRGVEALKDVCLQIPSGSVFGLVGVNGSGKTTLIRHIIGSLRAAHGRVRVLGRDPVIEHTEVLGRIGYLTEEDTLPGWMRVSQWLDFNRALYPRWDQRYAEELCDLFQLLPTHRIGSLSKGGRARVALLAAIAHRPELLILDEPSGGLDPIARSDILEAVIRTVSEDGRTVLFSSHLLEEVDRVCDCLALMREGRVIESLTIEQLESRYSEIVCRADSEWIPPSDLAFLFGWRRVGSEWSAVLDEKHEQTERSRWRERVPVSDRRGITLTRWFTARNESPTANLRGSTEEVTADA